MPLVAGIDSSTQSCKVVVCDTATGEIVRESRAPHPDGTEVDPARWWDALAVATAGLMDGVAAVSVAGQQHGMVALDQADEVVRPALLWNDTRSAAAAADLVAELGAAAWAAAVGTVPVASLTITKLRWLAEHEPANATQVASVLLPHDWLTWRLAGGSAAPTTDRGDASGTGYWSPSTGAYRHDLIERAFGRQLEVPRVAAPAELVGVTPDGIAIAAGTGDNMAAALGVRAGAGDVVVSLGTSGTVFAVSETPTHDAAGLVAGFADASGRFLPLVCTLNAARVLSAAATMLGTDLDGLDALAMQAPPGSDGVTLLPYLDGERTPNLPDASGALLGLTRRNMIATNIARAAVEGMLSCLADGLDALRAHGVRVERILLVGGAAQSSAVRAVAAGLFGAPVEVPHPGEYVALGAAYQAAWALTGRPPAWSGRDNLALPFDGAADAASHVRGAYATWRTRVYDV